MKYTIPTLMALSQVTDVVCNWTSNARDCNLIRPGLSKRPALKENSPNIAAVSSAVAQPSGKDSRSRAKSHCLPETTTRTPSNPFFTPREAGFARFLQEHSSPTHQRVTAGGRIVPMDHPARPPQTVADIANDGMDIFGSDSSGSEMSGSDTDVSLNTHDMTNSAPNEPASASTALSLNPQAPAFMPGGGETPAMNGAHIHSEQDQTGVVNIEPHASEAPIMNGAHINPEQDPNRVVNIVPHARESPFINGAHMIPEQDPNGAVDIVPHADDTVVDVVNAETIWHLIWPPFPWNATPFNNILAWSHSRLQIAAQLLVSPVPVSNIMDHLVLRGNPSLPFLPNQPIPVVFRGAELLNSDITGPAGQYWAIITEIFRLTNEGQFPSREDYRRSLGILVLCVASPQDDYEAFLLMHAIDWLSYQVRLFDELIASVDRRRAPLMGPNPHLTAERVYYVNQRGEVTLAIQELLRAMSRTLCSQACTFWRSLAFAALYGHVPTDRPWNMTSDRAEDPGDNRAESASTPDSSAPGENQAGAGGEVDAKGVGHAEAGSTTDSGPSQSHLSESQPAGGPTEVGPNAGSGGKVSSQSADVDIGPGKGRQVALGAQLSELSAGRGAHVAREEPVCSKAASDCLKMSVVTPTKSTSAVTRTDAHANKGKLSDVETMLARLRC